VKVTLESTSKTLTVNGVPARLWEGTTERGIRCFAFITRIACPVEADAAEFERDLETTRPPSIDLGVFPTKLVL
jgi:hypothetical protein